MTSMVIYFDGASRGNPGISGAGWIVLIEEKQVEGYLYLEGKTNNQAEYSALIQALKTALKYNKNKSTLLIKGDSELIIKQLNGEYAVKSSNLILLYSQVKDLLKNFDWKCKWIPRTENNKADNLANFAIDDFIISQRVKAQ